ncbi:TPA: hypothetical protein NID63_001986 [Pseudomonas aeruginosa]|uniref:Zinc binding domain n=1 Tax=Siphoviridae sp. ctnLs3 TaxID=2827937 RepID=A0A8S5TE01_9CAUD|nr:hypothetical protein [Pseudomonas aeruginosa]DAF61207.1 MAG TPA: Putative zinc binding domain [Siphoviridae sp. ctnLs3]EIU3463816.1 hypothetical protein [Pseudomonas aeruginosa]EIU3787345.1 hypothetical protein [Pseudomonas aeruginosa]EIU4990738.1 hypothetical protein [Pseudomonas aeruginosa]EIY2604769.1 hypothetical protein [Pseudomonas aeruginosa]
MSNVEPLKPREDGRLHPADVTIDQLIAVLEKLHPEGEDPTPCPVCAGTEWDVYEYEDRPVVMSIPIISRTVNPLLGTDSELRNFFFYTSCRKCGHMRAFLSDRIVQLASEL